MLHAERTLTVGRPAEDVFAYLADGTNNPRWRDAVIEIERTSDEVGEGAEYRQVLKGPGGRPIRGDYRVTRHDPPRLLEFEVTAGPARPNGRFELEPTTGDSTAVTFRLELEPRGPSRLFARLVRRQMEREVDALEGLKRDLEG